MNYNEFHSHKWSAVFQDAYQRLQKANEEKAAGNLVKAQEDFAKIQKGDFSDPEAIYPGVTMWVPYFRAVQGEMALRYQTLRANFTGTLDEANLEKVSRELFELFLSDARELLKRYGYLDPALVDEIAADGPEETGMPADWLEHYQDLSQRTELAVQQLDFSLALLQEWMALSLRGVLNYNFNLNRQAVLAGQMINQVGVDGLAEMIAHTREEFGWKVSQVFFRDTFGKLGLEQDQLYQLGRYAMFSDQILRSLDADISGEGILKARLSRVENCQLYSNFLTAGQILGHPVEHLSVAICEFCESHGQKNAALFTPPDMRPEYTRKQSVAYGADACLFQSVYYAGDEMDRFMEANEIIFAEETE